MPQRPSEPGCTLDLSVHLTAIPFNVAEILLHQQGTVKCELLSQIEPWCKHITDGIMDSSDYQHYGSRPVFSD